MNWIITQIIQTHICSHDSWWHWLITLFNQDILVTTILKVFYFCFYCERWPVCDTATVVTNYFLTSEPIANAMSLITPDSIGSAPPIRVTQASDMAGHVTVSLSPGYASYSELLLQPLPTEYDSASHDDLSADETFELQQTEPSPPAEKKVRVWVEFLCSQQVDWCTQWTLPLKNLKLLCSSLKHCRGRLKRSMKVNWNCFVAN